MKKLLYSECIFLMINKQTNKQISWVFATQERKKEWRATEGASKGARQVCATVSSTRGALKKHVSPPAPVRS